MRGANHHSLQHASKRMIKHPAGTASLSPREQSELSGVPINVLYDLPCWLSTPIPWMLEFCDPTALSNLQNPRRTLFTCSITALSETLCHSPTHAQPGPDPMLAGQLQTHTRVSIDAISLGKTPLSELDATPLGIHGAFIFLMVALNTPSYKLSLSLSGASTGPRAQEDRSSAWFTIGFRVPEAEAVSEDWEEWRTVERTREKWNTLGRAGAFTGKERGRHQWMPSCHICSLLMTVLSPAHCGSPLLW